MAGKIATYISIKKNFYLNLILNQLIFHKKIEELKKIIPTETINCIKVNCENLKLFFLK